MKKLLTLCLVCGPSIAVVLPLHITPNVKPAPQLSYGDQTAAVYQVFNTTKGTINKTFLDLALDILPAGMTVNTASHSFNNTQYCNDPFTLTPGAHCLVKVNITADNMPSPIASGPIVCLKKNTGVNCFQPSPSDQISITAMHSDLANCATNYNNFNAELSQNLDRLTGLVPGWGPPRNPLTMSANTLACFNTSSSGLAWARKRIIAAADFWIGQKLNYCHHYNPDWATPEGTARNATETQAGYCNPAPVNPEAALDPYYSTAQYPYIHTNAKVRWNYSGQGHETQSNWVNNNQMWYGFDCSNYTAFLYNFAFNMHFSSKTNFQAGQKFNDDLSPNTQDRNDANKILNNTDRAGLLLCADGTLDVDPNRPSMCQGRGGYLSSITSANRFRPVTISNLMRNGKPILEPGDILFIAGMGPDYHPNPDGTNSSVTHAIMWVGKQVGYGADDINPSLIAPSSSPCAAYAKWGPHIGDWVITDSHYQGADYRVLSQCFYLNNLWGVRRVLHA